MYRARSSVALQQNFPTWMMRPVSCNLNRSLEKVGETWVICLLGCASNPYTVDGRNPAPVDMLNILLFPGFHTCSVVQDFLQQYQMYQTSLKFVGFQKQIPSLKLTFSPLKIPLLESMNFLLGPGPVAGGEKKWLVSGSVASDQQIVVWTVVSGSRNRG